MNSAAHDIALYLQDQGVGTFGVDLFVGHEPTDPPDCTTIYDYPGLDADTDEMDIRQPNFQVRVRSPRYEVANNKHEEIFRALTEHKVGFDAPTSTFSVVVLNTDVSSLGRDANQRMILVANYRARRTQKET